MLKTLPLSAALLAAACLVAFAHEAHKKSAARGTEAPAPTPIEDTSVQPPRPAVGELKVLASHLKQPEYIHVIFNVLPLMGMALGAALLLAGLRLESEGIREAGLSLAILAGVVTFPTIKSGQRAYNRLYERIPLEAQQWLDVHMSRAENLQWLFYLTALLAAWALFSSRKKRPGALRQAKAALAAAGLCAALAAWIGHAGGQVRHPEFRLGPPLRGAQPMREHDRPTEP